MIGRQAIRRSIALGRANAKGGAAASSSRSTITKIAQSNHINVRQAQVQSSFNTNGLVRSFSTDPKANEQEKETTPQATTPASPPEKVAATKNKRTGKYEIEHYVLERIMAHLRQPSRYRDILLRNNEHEPAELTAYRYRQEFFYRIKDKQETSLFWRLAKLIGYGTKKDERVLAATGLYLLTRDQAERPEWLALGLPDSLNSWHSIVMVHFWMMEFRLRNMENLWDHRGLRQLMVDFFFEDIEEAVIKITGTANPFITGKAKKDLWMSHLGEMLSYDDAVLKGDAQLADALFANLFVGAQEKVTAQQLDKMVQYIRREMKRLDDLPDEMLRIGKIKWGPPPNFE